MEIESTPKQATRILLLFNHYWLLHRTIWRTVARNGKRAELRSCHSGKNKNPADGRVFKSAGE
jgi:hypothetical protein